MLKVPRVIRGQIQKSFMAYMQPAKDLLACVHVFVMTDQRRQLLQETASFRRTVNARIKLHWYKISSCSFSHDHLIAVFTTTLFNYFILLIVFFFCLFVCLFFFYVQYKRNLVRWPVTSGFNFVFDAIRPGPRSLRSPDKVIFFMYRPNYNNMGTVFKRPYSYEYLQTDICFWLSYIFPFQLIIPQFLFNTNR